VTDIKYSPYHDWGDEDFDWAALNAACLYLSKRCRQFARMGIWTKEKYGTLRVSTTCAYFTEYGVINHLFYPRYVRYMFPKWFRQYIDRPLGRALGAIGVIGLLQRYQTATLKYFWKRAAKKWPHISEEILDEWSMYFD
jgi:hypothetical protein